MTYDTAIMIGVVGLFFMFGFFYDRSENPFIKTTFLGWLMLIPYFVLYWASKLEELNPITGKFWHSILVGYGVYLFMFLIFQLYTYFFQAGRDITDRQ